MPFHQLILNLKRLVYGRSGEPYRFGDQTLHFLPGTRPVRLKYRNSPSANVRNDALQVELVHKSLKEGDTAIDIGAHAGQYAVLMSACCGTSGQVYSFEPDPDAAISFQRNVALNCGLKPPVLTNAACSDANGSATFFTQGGNSQSSLAKSALPQQRDTNEIVVETIRLDDWCAAMSITPPRLVKIDTEGAEVHVLRGMPKILDSDAVIVCELHPFAWEEFGVCFEDLDELAKQHGRRLVWLDGRGEVAPPGEYGTVLLERGAN